MATKVTFDPTTRSINVTQAPVNGVVTLNVKEDLYSEGKDDWRTIPTLQGSYFPIEPLGGNTIPIGVLGDSYILQRGWHIHPYEADHELVIEGNLFPEIGELVADTVGSYRVVVTRQVSTLVEVRTDTTSAADLALLRKIMDNRFVTDPVTGKATLYDDDGVTPLREWNLWEDTGQTQPYRSQGTEERGAPVDLT